MSKEKHYHIRNAFNKFWTASGWGEYDHRMIIIEHEMLKKDLPPGGFWQMEHYL